MNKANISASAARGPTVPDCLDLLRVPHLHLLVPHGALCTLLALKDVEQVSLPPPLPPLVTR